LNNKYKNKNQFNLFGLVWWCWLETLEYAQGLKFNSLQCQFE